MLGLGVRRLKTRPSLLDLIASRQPAQTEEREEEEHQGNEEKGPSSSPPGPDQLPPLPVSPASASSDSSVLHPSTSEIYQVVQFRYVTLISQWAKSR